MLTKPELVALIRWRARADHGLVFDAASLNDLIKDGLMPAATRIGHIGRKPHYGYDWKAYRRGLQLVRLRARGVVGRDAIKVQLFVCGYSLPAYDLREALWNEYRNHTVSLLSKTRSRYIQNTRVIPPKHRAALIRVMGDLDSDLDGAGLRLDPDIYIEAFRSGLSGPWQTPSIPLMISAAIENFRRNETWETAVQPFLPLIAGLLLVEDSAAFEPSGKVDYIERVIRQASDERLNRVQNLFQTSLLLARRFPSLSRTIGWRQGESQRNRAIEKVIDSAHHPPWTALLLITALRIPERFLPDVRPEEATKFLDFVGTNGFNFLSDHHRVTP